MCVIGKVTASTVDHVTESGWPVDSDIRVLSAANEVAYYRPMSSSRQKARVLFIVHSGILKRMDRSATLKPNCGVIRYLGGERTDK